jgi:flavodoxin short chain
MVSVAIVYWSGHGATKAMARLIAEGVADAGGEVTLFEAASFNPAAVRGYDVVALGCPAMHVEQLEKTTFEPLMQELDSRLDGVRVALFGSFGWGQGEWMDAWKVRIDADDAQLVGSLKVNGQPTGAQAERCRAFGASLAKVHEPSLAV